MEEIHLGTKIAFTNENLTKLGLILVESFNFCRFWGVLLGFRGGCLFGWFLFVWGFFLFGFSLLVFGFVVVVSLQNNPYHQLKSFVFGRVQTTHFDHH